MKLGLKGLASRGLAVASESVRTALFARTAPMLNSHALASFTFDDFPRSAVFNGARVLEDHGARGTFYMAGSYCGRVVDGIEQYGVEDLLLLANAGHEIGCHSFTHPRMSALSAFELRNEINRNADFLALHLPSAALRTFAYPYGDLSFGSTRHLQSRFAGCRSSKPGLNVGTADLGRLRSIRLYDRLVRPEHILHVVEQAAKTRAWVIFYTHDVAEAPSDFGCTPALLVSALKAVVAAGVEILTVDAAIKAVTHRHCASEKDESTERR
jgi:peptidoglycan/xylan/chitin deacetylase (PgdA/CDA1 family)